MNRKENTSDVRTFLCLAFPLIGLFALICLIPFLLIIASSLTSESSTIRYGYNRYDSGTMLITVVLLVIMVQIIQSVGSRIAKRSDKRIND